MARQRNNNKKWSKNGSAERNNFQDMAEEREFKKGFKKGKNFSAKSGKYYDSSKAQGHSTIKEGSQPIIGAKEGNDISWHNPNSQMFERATGVTFNTSVGLPLIVNPDSGSAYTTWQGQDVKSPGIISAYFVPSMGEAKTGNDPVNEAMVSLFQYIRRNKSGREIYQPADVGMVIGALDSAYMFYEFCCKIYGMAQDINIFNTYVPQSMLAAHGVQFKSVSRNLSDFNFWINDFATRLRGFFVPKGIHLFDRHTYMTRGLFTDSDTNKAQYYAFVPTHYMQFVEGTEASPFTSLQYKMLINPATMGAANPSNWLTVEQLMDFGDALIAPLLDSEAVRNITADMLTAFPENGSYSIGDLPSNYVVKPTYDKQILMQFENAFMYGYGSTVAGGYSQVTEINNSYMVSTLSITPNAAPQPPTTQSNKTWNTIQVIRNILNFHWNDVTSEDIMYATRLAGFGFAGPQDEDGTPNDSQILKTHGSEIITTCNLWYYAYQNESQPFSARELQSFSFQTYLMASLGISKNITEGSETHTYILQSTANQTAVTLANHLSQLAKFDWHPKVYPIIYSVRDNGGFTTTLSRTDPIFDIDTFALITEQQLAQMNRVSLLGLLICRDMGTYSREITS